jgi:hypothetical protein
MDMSTTRFIFNVLVGTSTGILGTTLAKAMGSKAPTLDEAAKVGAISGGLISLIELSWLLLVKKLANINNVSIRNVLHNHCTLDHPDLALGSVLLSISTGPLFSKHCLGGAMTLKQATLVFASGGLLIGAFIKGYHEVSHLKHKAKDIRASDNANNPPSARP